MHEKTRKILDLFAGINAIPRCSRHEQRLSAWLAAWAENNRFHTRSDATGNRVIIVPPSPGFEPAPTVVLQGHMDMVCEKTPESAHDFSTDPIPLVIDGEWVTAEDTSLGADNGIALAIAMALATDASVAHPPLELLFTVDEESGLTGAQHLDPGLFTGRILLNIDSETEGVFTIGCAGGQNTRMVLPVSPQPLSDGQRVHRIAVTGLSGGHSGIDIHKQRANANVLLGRTLGSIQRHVPVRLVSLSGGTVHNAIPRDAAAVVACDGAAAEALCRIVAQFEAVVRSEFAGTDPQLALRATAHDELRATPAAGLSPGQTLSVTRLIQALPHGVMGMSGTMPGLVETSTNLATVALKGSAVDILTSQRSAVSSQLEAAADRVKAIAALAGADVTTDNAYPPWQPEMDSPLLERCRRVYRERFGKAPEQEVIHAGLECAIIGSKLAGMQMISFGPTLENPHSPDERLHIPSIDRIWSFMVSLLASYGS